MGRINTMARFNEDVPEESSIDMCLSCFELLYTGNWVIKYEHETFCDIRCFADYMGIKETILTGHK